MSEYTKKVRMDPMFLRNQFFSVGKYDIPLFRKQSVPVENLEIIGYQNAKCDDPHASKRIVHGFKDDDRCINSVFKIEKRNTVVPIIGAKRIVQKGQNVTELNALKSGDYEDLAALIMADAYRKQGAPENNDDREKQPANI